MWVSQAPNLHLAMQLLTKNMVIIRPEQNIICNKTHFKTVLRISRPLFTVYRQLFVDYMVSSQLMKRRKENELNDINQNKKRSVTRRRNVSGITLTLKLGSSNITSCLLCTALLTHILAAF